MTHRQEAPTSSDTQLIERCLQGDHSAYGLIVTRYQCLVCSVAYSRCGDLVLSEDLAQEAFLAAWGKLAELRDSSRFKSWVCSITRNLAGRAAKREHRAITRSAAQLDAAIGMSTSAPEPDARIVAAEESQLVWKALAEMQEEYREPMILYYREEQSVARVAEALDLSADAVKQRLSRGRRMLNEKLTATIEKTLAKTRPSAGFTVAVVAAISGATATKATAAGLSTATAAAAKAGVGGSAGISLLSTVGQLAVLRWLYTTSLGQARSVRERQLFRRYFLVNGLVVLLFAAATFSSIWWQQFLPDAFWIRALTIPGLMVMTYIPLFVTTARLNKQIKRLREEEGTATLHRPLPQTSEPGMWSAKTYLIFVASGLLVIAWPATLAIGAADWAVLAGVLMLSTMSGIVTYWLSLRGPSYAFQCYGIHIAVASLLGIAATWFQRDVWSPGVGWASFYVVMSGMVTTQIVLTTLVWKKVYGK